MVGLGVLLVACKKLEKGVHHTYIGAGDEHITTTELLRLVCAPVVTDTPGAGKLTLGTTGAPALTHTHTKMSVLDSEL